MIQSQFIKDIFDLLFDGDDISESLRRQVIYLTEREYEYTGVGVFISFVKSDNINQYRIEPYLTTISATSSTTNKIEKIEDFGNNKVINGVIIKDEENNIEADAQVFLNDGIIDYLEIWNRLGDYPKNELSKYTLIQEWTGSPGRTIRRPEPNTR